MGGATEPLAVDLLLLKLEGTSVTVTGFYLKECYCAGLESDVMVYILGMEAFLFGTLLLSVFAASGVG